MLQLFKSPHGNPHKCEECQKWCGDFNNLIDHIIDHDNQSEITQLLDVSMQFRKRVGRSSHQNLNLH